MNTVWLNWNVSPLALVLSFSYDLKKSRWVPQIPQRISDHKLDDDVSLDKKKINFTWLIGDTVSFPLSQ